MLITVNEPSREPLTQPGRGQGDCSTRRRRGGQGIQHDKVMNGPLEARSRDEPPGLAQLGSTPGRQAVRNDLALGEIIVYSGSILVIVLEVTGHRVTSSPLIPSHCCNFGRHKERDRS